MTNWIATPTLTKDLALQWVDTSLSQDIGDVNLLAWVNGSASTVMALEALKNPKIFIVDAGSNIGVGPAWNQICHLLFGGVLGGGQAEHILITNDDILMRPDTYRHLLIPKGGFVTPINVGDWEKCKKASFLVEEEPVMKGGPDFSCFLLKRWFYEGVGPFPECYPLAYFEDRDFHMQAIGKGLGDQIYSITFPYYHEASQTIKRNPEIAQQNSIQFELNKQTFIKRWGGPPHAETFKEPQE